MRKLFLLITSLLIISLGQVQAQVEATTISELNMRSGPAVTYAIIETLPPETPISVEGRNDAGDWAFIHTDDGKSGWVAMGFIRFDHAIRIMEELNPVSETVTAVDANGDVIPPPPMVLVESTTTFPTIVLNIDSARAIYNRGLSLGRNPAVFMKVGESNIAGTVFLCNFQWGNYALGDDNAYLSEIVDYFNQTGSFCRYNVSAEPGFSTSSLFDPTFSPSAACDPNETPIDCEMRRSQAMYAFVYIGIGDQKFTTAEGFRVNYVRLVRTLKRNGVIPILATYPMADFFNEDGKPPAFNKVIREVAGAERVPLIDVRAATFNFDNRGTGPDGYHLSVPDGAPTFFTGDQEHYGRTLYEFNAMQVLYKLYTAFNG